MALNSTLPPSLRLPKSHWPRADLEEWAHRFGPDKDAYKPRGAAAVLQDCTLPEILISGPAGTGKSLACFQKMYQAATKYPGFRGLVLRKTRRSLTDTGLVTFERDVLGLDHPLVIDGARRQYRSSYAFDNGSEIVIGGIDKPGRILSAEYDMIFIQQVEEFTDEEDWETLITRLRGQALPSNMQQIIADANPASPRHWIKQRADAGTVKLLESRHEDNPLLWEDDDWTEYGTEYISRLDRLTGARKQRLRYGRWVQAEGVVYDEFDAAKHVIPKRDIPDDWPRLRVVDFGYTNAFVCQWWAQDGDGRLYLYRELYMTGRTVREHAGTIKLYSADENILATVCDHDAEDMATLEENGIECLPATKDVMVGIQRVKERLKEAGDGKPRLYFLEDALIEVDQDLAEAKQPYSTVQEIDSYIWNDKKTKDEPVKESDHGMDAMRYLVMYVDPVDDWVWTGG